MAAERTAITAGWVVAYDGRGHRLLRDGEVIYEGNTIVHVGPAGGFAGTVDHRLDARDGVLTPGFVNTHIHVGGSPLDKSFLEDRGPRQFYLSGLFEYLPARAAAQDEAATRACITYSMAELIRTGTTTFLEMGTAAEAVVEETAKAGLRAYVGPIYRSGRWYTDDGLTVRYAWEEDDGRAAFDRAVAFIERTAGSHGGRIQGFLSPAQVDTCSEALLRRTAEVARRLGVPVQLHVSQSVVEFQEMQRRHGLSPIEWLERIEFLTPTTILGHAIICGGGSWANFHAEDIAIMARHGCAVAHAAWVFARRGIAMESFARYLAAGITMTLGTDTCPQSMIEAQRWAAVLSKIVDRRTDVATAADVFTAATLGGARALGRDDLGRIAPGARADLLLWGGGGTSLFMTPLRDPIKNIVYNAQAEDLRAVVVDGRTLMADGRVLTVDEQAATVALQAAGERLWPRLTEVDYRHRSADELSPLSYPRWE
jgi:cytosine/adenosine deaminase-related metal-dependent hydrolase